MGVLCCKLYYCLFCVAAGAAEAATSKWGVGNRVNRCDGAVASTCGPPGSTACPALSLKHGVFIVSYHYVFIGPELASVLYLHPSCQPGIRQGGVSAAGQAVKHPIVICSDMDFARSNDFCYGCTSVRNAQSKRHSQRCGEKVGNGSFSANGSATLRPAQSSIQ